MTSQLLNPVTYHEKFSKNLKPRLTFSADSGTSLSIWKRTVKKSLLDKTGLTQLLKEKRSPLKPKILWTKEDDSITLSKLIIQVEPGLYANAFISIPHRARRKKGKMPWMIALQGHSSGAHQSVAVDYHDNFKSFKVEGDRDFAISCAEQGIACLALEQRGFGERRNHLNRKTDCFRSSMQALQLGRTMIGERVFDVDRALDYLSTRKDVDWKKVGIMGNSGGGTTSLFSAAILKRISFAMPSCYFSTFKASIMAMHHCECNYVPGLLEDVEMADILGLFAPKPVVIVAGKEDPIFPIRSVRSEYRRLKEIYQSTSGKDSLRLVIGEGGHRFYANQAWAAAHQIFDFGTFPE
jgi:dienelactone hydrolase